ncbi:hypothetical protein SLEP1_g45074 [Rubroshorea leprosula]|uniref:Terpene synthase N-terminal domain-containing protein n=1 Tax=Rubroshorea leprosula TaxID=152421 RepID=A0AAV5LHZ3_9ROSI|nr:hypothetical protein SLEP1_g45074 [Rubroshorea leprosula]
MDCKGMLYLYEASFLSLEGESTLDAARTFAKNYLSEYVKLNKSKNPYLSTLVEHALEFPLRWRMPRMEARWFIGVINEVQIRIPSCLILPSWISTWCKRSTRKI